MGMITREYALDRISVQKLLEDFSSFLDGEKIERRNALRMSLTLEELLLRIIEHEGAPGTCTLTVGRRFSRPVAILRYGGERFDPTLEGGDTWNSQLLERLGLSPEWSFRAGVNSLRLRPPRQNGPGRLMLLLAAAVAAGVLGAAGMLLPAALREGAVEVLLTPMFNAFLGLLNTFAGIMIFFSVSSGVFGIGDTASLSGIGRTMFPRFIGSVFAVSAASLAISLPFMHPVSSGVSGGSSQLREVSEMIFSILPSNPIRPFYDCNTLQIIVMAVFTGIVLLMLGERVRHVSRFFEESGSLMQSMMEQVCRLIPLFVFVSLLRQIWSGSALELLGLWKPFVIYLLINLLLAAILLASASLRTHASPLLLLRKVIPAFLIAFTTASSMAAYSTMSDSCERQLGVDKKLLDLGLPIGIVIYMPAGTVTFAVLSLYFAELYGIETDVTWFINAFVLSAALSIAIPPTPGAMLTCYGIMLAQLGLPSRGLLLAAALDVAMDFFSTGFDVLDIELEMISQSSLLSMLDSETLHKKK